MTSPKGWFHSLIHLLGSLKLAVVLLLSLAGVIAVATVLETDHGRDHAQWYVYQSPWFVALLGFLGVNILFATIVRLPWKRRHTGFVVTHAGLLVLLAGSIRTFLGGVDGQVTLTEGEVATTMILPQQTQVTVSWANRSKEPPYHFTFESGPRSWSEGTTLDIGELDGISVRVLHNYRHAKAVESWIGDDRKICGPAVTFKLAGPHQDASLEQLLVDQGFGDEFQAGPLRFQLRSAATESMLAHFLETPSTELAEKTRAPVSGARTVGLMGSPFGPFLAASTLMPTETKGVLLVYHKDKVTKMVVADHIGKKTIVDDSGLAVEIVDYLANARSDIPGKFTSVGKEPRNPLLDLQVHVPHKGTLRQLAFAQNPLLNLDAVTGQSCPVAFEYVHPAVKPGNGLELMQGADGQLYARVIANQERKPAEKIRASSRIPLQGGFTFTLVEHLPHARSRIEFQPQELDAQTKDKSESVSEVEISVAGVTQTVWLQRNHPTLGTRTIVTPQGILRVGLGYGEAPLGFAIKLEKFQRDVNPGGVGNAAFASTVRLLDKHQGFDEERTISMNEPLTCNRLTLYQSSFGKNEMGHGLATSTFSVAHDPGRLLKYAGSLMICLGIAIMFYMRAYFFKPSSGTSQNQVEEVAAEGEVTVLAFRVAVEVPDGDADNLREAAANVSPQEPVTTGGSLVR